MFVSVDEFFGARASVKWLRYPWLEVDCGVYFAALGLTKTAGSARSKGIEVT